MKRVDIEKIKHRLESQRQEVLYFLSRLEDETRSLDVDSTQDSADRCVMSVSKESLFERAGQRRKDLRLIEAALRRIADGSFGVCASCGEDIQDRRLQAVPWTQYCLACQQALEAERGGASMPAHTTMQTSVTWRRAG